MIKKYKGEEVIDIVKREVESQEELISRNPWHLADILHKSCCHPEWSQGPMDGQPFYTQSYIYLILLSTLLFPSTYDHTGTYSSTRFL